MISRFLDTMTFGALLAPHTKESFAAQHWERVPLIVHRGNPHYYGDLFTLEDFDRELANSPSAIHTAEAKSKKHTRYIAEKRSLPLETVLADMRSGATLLLDAVNEHEQKLGLLCRLLQQELGHRFQANAYLTPPRGQGFTPHWDNHDVFVLQVLGSKHWKIEKQRRKLPERFENIGDNGRELRGDVYSFTLEQGDLIYIPRGFVHAAECESEPSLHITLGVAAFFFEDFLHAAIKAKVRSENSLRVALPLGFMRDGLGDIATNVQKAFREMADETFVSSVVDAYRDKLVTTFPPDVSGQVTAFIQGIQLKISDVVGPRRGLSYRTYSADNSVRLNFGTRSIIFEDTFRQALDFALSTPNFAISALPGDLEDVERIAFIERLMQEGLVIQKQNVEFTAG